MYAARPGEWGFLKHTPLARPTGGLPDFELVPSAQGQFHGAAVRTNRWGMRDQDYEKTPQPTTLRIALLGSSHVFGDGVENEETFETLLEQRLNQEVKGAPYERYEILNFAVGGYSALDCMAVLEDKVFEFKPQYIFYVELRAPWGAPCGTSRLALAFRRIGATTSCSASSTRSGSRTRRRPPRCERS